MKSEFLRKLSEVLLPDKETDYVDFYYLQGIKNWPMVTVSQHDSENGETESGPVESVDDHKPEDIEYLTLENCELIYFDEKTLIINAGGDFQIPYRITIGLKDEELCVLSFVVCPEINKEEDIADLDLNKYEALIESFQTILEHQD